MKDLAGVDHALQPAATLGGALDRQQKRQQPFPVFRAGIFLQSLAERDMLGFGFSRKPCRGCRPLRNSCTESLASASSTSKAASMPRQRSAKTAAVRYSAPVIGGTVAAILSSSPFA